jgi:hypothetical protein
MATQISLNDGAIASAGALAIQTNGTTQAVSISTGQVATLAQNPILTSGTANGVAYLNGSKVLTSGTALKWNGTNLAIGAGATTQGNVEIQATGTDAGLWVQTGGTTNSYVIADFRNGSNSSAFKIFGNARSTFLTTVGVGEATPSTSGSGITFPATQSASSDANTLDDYEEGTWTPSVGGTATYGAQTGYYVKVGKIVYVKGTIITTLIGTGSTNTISGLPFTCRVTTPLSVAYFDTINTAATFLGIRISQANTTMLLVGTTAAQATITDSFSTFKNGTYLEFAGVYEVA